MRLFSKLFICVAVCVPLLWVQAAGAADLPRIMLMGEDADKDSVPRGSRPFKRVMSALVTGLQAEGFNDVYDEGALSGGVPDRGKRRNVERLLEVARDAGADVIVLFTIYWDIEKGSYATKLKGRIEGRLLSVFDGRMLGNFERASKKSVKLPDVCERECKLEALGSLSKRLAQTVAEALRQKLADFVGGGANADADDSSAGPVAEFVIIMDGFNQDERDAMEEMLEEMLEGMSGSVGLRPKTNEDNGPRYQAYWYTTRARSAKLQRNIRKAMKAIYVRGIMDFTGNTINLTKTGRIKK